MKNKNTQNVRRFAGEAFWVSLGQCLGTLGALVGVRILTHLLEPEAYGYLNLAMSGTIFVAFVFGDLFMNTSMRFYSPAYELKQLNVYLASLKILISRFSSIFLVLGVSSVIMLKIAGYEKILSYVLPGVVLSLLLAINSACDGIQTGARNRFVVAMNYASLQWLRFTFACLFVVMISPEGSTALWGYVFASFVVLFVQAFFLKRNFGKHFESVAAKSDIKITIRKMVSFSWPFVIIGFFSWLLSFADRWSLTYFSDAKQVGYYVALVQIGYFPILFGTKVLIQLISPLLYEHVENDQANNNLEYVGKMNKYVVALVFFLILIASLFLHVFHYPIFSIFVDSGYSHVSYLLPWTVLAAGVLACGQVLLVSVLSGYATRQVIPVVVTASLIGVPVYCVGAYFYGIDGVVFGMNIVSVVYLLLAYYVHVKIIKNSLTEPKCA